MAKTLLFLGYAIDLIWLFAAFIYAFVLCLSPRYHVTTNKYLTGRRAYACLILIAAWWYYVYADATHAYQWLQQDYGITSDDIFEKAGREWLSVLTSILTTLLIMGCKFGENENRQIP